MSLTKFVELERTMQRGVHLNKSHLDLMQNARAKVVDFYYERKKVRPLRIWSRRTVECRSNQSTPRLSWLLGLEWNKHRKDLSQPHQAFKSQACHGGQKLFFSIHFLCLTFLSHSLVLIFYCTCKKVQIRHIWSRHTLYSTELWVKILCMECTRSQHLYQ